MELISNDIRKQHFRFNELMDLHNKADGRRQLTFEDKGYVDDIDLFLVGCMSYMPLGFNIDGSSVDWRLLNNERQFKTLLDFCEGRIKCRGMLIDEIAGFLRSRIKREQIIICYVINPTIGKDRDVMAEYLRKY